MSRSHRVKEKLILFTKEILDRPEWLKGDKFVFEVEKFIDAFLARSRSENPYKSLTEYLRSLSRYCKFAGKTPTELIDAEEENAKLPRRKRQSPAEIWLSDFINHIEEEYGLTHNSRVWVSAHIKSFYRRNGFPIDFPTPKVEKTKEKVRMTRKLAREALNTAESLKVRALVHFLWSTGLSISDAVRIKKSDIERIVEWGVISTTRKKTGKHFMTIVTPDCLVTLERWWKNQDEEDDTVLGYQTSYAGQAIAHALRRLAVKMKLKDNKGKIYDGEGKSPLHAHNFRHGFNNALKNKEMDSQLVEFMLGHKIGVSEHYNEITPEKLVERVKPYYDALRLIGKISNNRVEELEKQVTELREMLVESYATQIEGLTKRIERLEKKKSKRAPTK